MSDYQYYNYNQNNSEQNGNPYNPYQREPKEKKPKKDRPFVKKMGKAVAIALAFGLVAGATFQGSSYLTGKLIGTDTVAEKEADKEETAAKEDATQLSSSDGQLDSTAVSTATTVTDVADIAENVMPAIVQVTTVTVTEYRDFFGRYGTYEGEGAGSGVIISQDSDYVYIATNNHVVSGARELTITFADDEAVAAEIQGTDPNTDLAVVKVAIKDIDSKTLSTIKVATLGDSDSIKVGEGSVVIGNALGYGQSVTTGVISALSREVKLEGDDGNVITNELIQTDAAVNPGNSGGALLNMNGEVIGIVSAKYSDTDVEGMGYAIPITEAKSIIEMLMSGKTASNESGESTQEAYLGISGVDVNSANAAEYDMPTGVYIAGVYADSGAYEAGLVRGDVVIGLDGNRISTMEQIQSALQKKKPGDTVQLTVATAKSDYLENVTVDVTLVAKDALQ